MTKVLLSVTLSLLLFVSAAYAGTQQSRLDEAERLHARGENAKCLLMANGIIEAMGAARDMRRADSVTLMRAEYLCGKVNISRGNGAKGIAMLKKAADMAKATGDTKFLAQIYNSMFYVYYSALDFAQAQNLLAQAIDLSAKSGDRRNLTRLYNNKGLTFYAQRRHSEALALMRKALDNTLPGERQDRSQIYTNIAEVYFSQGAYADAERWLTKALDELRQMPLNFKNIQTYLNMALLKARCGKTGEAKDIQRKIHGVLPSLPLPQKVNSMRQLADISFCTGDSMRGLRYMIAYDALADSLQKTDNNSQMRQLLVAYDAERLAQHNAALTQSLRARTVITCGSLAFLAVVLALSAVLWIKSRENRRKSRLIAEQKERLLLYEQKEHERRRREMQLELDYKSRQLTSYTIDLAAVNDFHQKVGGEMEKLQTAIDCGDTASARDGLKRVGDMMAHFNDKPVNDDFRIFFEEVHPDYLKKLSRTYPKLSENDLRLCAYILLGMSTKEIAALTYREVRSVESSRNRLRKKLGLPAGGDVKAFLETLAGRFNTGQ